MKLGMWVIVGMIVGVTAISCLASERADARPTVKGLENVEPEIQEHFAELLLNSIDANSFSVAENEDEKFVIVDTGEELRVYMLVKDKEGYGIAVEIAVEKNANLTSDDYTELVSSVLQSNHQLLAESIRLANIREDFKNGKSLSDLSLKQVQLQSKTVSDEDPIETAEVHCSGSGTAVCCGFEGGSGVRVLCICNSGSNGWSLCFDSGWLK